MPQNAGVYGTQIAAGKTKHEELKIMTITYGLNKKLFSQLVNETLFKTGLSYREAASLLGISPSTLTRVKKLKSINVDSFMIILHWIEINSNKDYNDLLTDLLSQLQK